MFGSIKLVSPRHLLLKCLYQAMKVSGHIYIKGIDLTSVSTIVLLDFETVLKMW